MTAFEIAEFVFNGAFSSLWPMILLPYLARIVSNRAAKRLSPTRADWRTAACLSGFPGLVMLILCAMAIGRAAGHLHAGDLEHDITFRVTPLIAIALLLRALLRTYRRADELYRVTSLAIVPSARLSTAAHTVGIVTRELPLDDCECFVTGFRRPTAYVSSGAVSRMTDAELKAALRHEHAHAAAFDPAIFATLCFLSDIFPGSERALTAYRQARERFADFEAIKCSNPLDLASALLAVSRAPPPRVHAVSMVSPGTGTWRLDALLGIEAPEEISSSVVGSMSVNSLLAVWPLPHLYLAYIFCF